jgi:hypothetical protein
LLRPLARCYGAQTPPKSTIVRMWILHNRVTLGPYITDTRARTRYWSSTNHRNPKEPSHDSSRRYYICRLRVHVTRAAVDVGSLACLLLRTPPDRAFRPQAYRESSSAECSMGFFVRVATPEIDYYCSKPHCWHGRNSRKAFSSQSPERTASFAPHGRRTTAASCCDGRCPDAREQRQRRP